MKEYLDKVGKTVEGKWKHRFVAWGGSLDICRRKELEIEKLMRLKADNERIGIQYGKLESIESISLCYNEEIENIKDIISNIMQEKHRVDLLVAQLLPEEQKFLNLRFEKGYQYEYIAMKTNLSRSSCFRTMSKIIDFFEKNADF